MMKNIKISTLLMLLFCCISLNTALADPCPDNEDVDFANLPAAALTYINTNFPNLEKDDAEKFTVNGIITYLVELEDDATGDDTLLAFDDKGTFLGSNTEKEFDQNALPALGINNLDQSFSGIAIDEIESTLSWTGETLYEIELDNNVEILMDMNGNMVCEDK